MDGVLKGKSISIIYAGEKIGGVQSYEYSIENEIGEIMSFNSYDPVWISQKGRKITLTLGRCMMYTFRHTFKDLLDKEFNVQIERTWTSGEKEILTFEGCTIQSLKESCDATDYVKEVIVCRAKSVVND